MYGNKIAMVIRKDLLTWQKLNVAAFLASSLLTRPVSFIAGEAYRKYFFPLRILVKSDDPQ